MNGVVSRFRLALWRLFRVPHRDYPFRDLKAYLRTREAHRSRERKRYLKSYYAAFRRWNRPVKRLLYQLADALQQSSEWRHRGMNVRAMSSRGDPPHTMGWRLFWMCPYGPSENMIRATDDMDIVTVHLTLNGTGAPEAFHVAKEEDGRKIVTKEVTRDALVAALRDLFLGDEDTESGGGAESAADGREVSG
jgi:hypothetical protein